MMISGRRGDGDPDWWEHAQGDIKRVQNFSSNILWQDTALDTCHRCEDNIKNSICVSGLGRVHFLVRVNRGGPSGSMEGTECFI